ncbi:MAG: triose-phosphate isomerase [Candidatus Omnitrophica bacterium]|nr:triose-phosphate isomerase [Candidatus Omnitrophota bacterium]
MIKPLIAGNWKMYKTSQEGVKLVGTIKAGVHSVDDCDIVICPPFTLLSTINPLLDGTRIALGAQNMYVEKEGAFTGEISPLMLKDLGCRYVILGHSERRQYFGETDSLINKKVIAALTFSLIPIVCVGETLPERESGKAKETVKAQAEGALAGLSAEQFEKLIVAYEPVWAIGTGKTASSGEAQEMHEWIRALLAERAGKEIAAKIRILYGGSVKPENISGIMAQPDVNGALVGGACLKAESFIQIIRGAKKKELTC